MPAFRYTISRTSIVCETYTVEADSEEEAIALADWGAIDYDNNMVSQEFIDWYGDEWSVDHKEDLCPLTKMIKEYNAAA